jgi:hypothetical protein
MDLTSRLNNEVARYIDRFSEREARSLLPRVRSYEFKSVSQLIEEKEPTGYNNQVFLEEDYGDVENDSLPAAAIASINLLNMDPAKSVMSRFKIRTQDDALMGTIPASETTHAGKKGKIIRTLRRDFTDVTNNQSLASMDPNDLVPVVVRRPKRYVTIRRKVKIHRRVFRRAKRFDVVVELLDREGGIVQREIHKVNHASLTKDYYIPRKAPLLRYVGSDFGENVLEVMQRDKKCDSVGLYRRIINDSTKLINEEWDFVGKFKLRKRGRRRSSRRFQRIIDSVQNTNPIIYRAVPIRGRRKGLAFKSVVAPPVKLGTENKVIRNKMCTLFMTSGPMGVTIEARNYDPSADFIALHRKDITGNERTFRRLSKEVSQVDTTPTAYKPLDKAITTFVDNSVKDGRVYEYFVEMLYKDGTSFRAIGSDFIEYQKPDDEIEFELDNIRITDNRQAPDFSMKINLKEGGKGGKTNTTEILKNYQRRSGTRALYQEEDQLQEKRDLSNQITVFLITRCNLTTGQKEQFNVYDPGSNVRFTDSSLGRSSRISPLESGNEYRYVVTGCKLPASALLKRAKITSRDRRTGRKYRMSTAKSRSRKGLRRGTVYPARGRSRNTGKNAIFNASKTGSTKVVSVDLRTSKPSITHGDVDKINNYENKLTWRIKGTAAKIDHFIISIELRRSSIPILTAMCHPGQRTFELIDKFTPRIRGPVEFKVTPVYLDFTRGDDYDLGTIVSSGIANKRRRQGRTG